MDKRPVRKPKYFKKMSLISYVDPSFILDDKELKNKMKLTAFSLCGDFPIDIDPALEEEEDITDEILKEIIRDVHATTSRIASISRLQVRFKNISKVSLRNKLDEITVSGVIIDPEIYLRNVAD